eukprot:475479_1
MTHILTGICVSEEIGYSLQIIFIIWSFVLWSFYTIHLNRFVNKKKRTSLDILFICVISLIIIPECIRVIDPFSMNNIFSFTVNRIFFILFPCFSVPVVVVLLIDTYLAMIYRIKKQLRPKKYRFIVLFTISTIETLPSIIIIISFVALSDEYILHILFCLYMATNTLDKVIHIALQRYLSTKIKKELAYEISSDNEENDELNVEDNYESERYKEIMIHSQERLLKSIDRHVILVIFIVIYYIFEFIDGGIAINGKCYFIPGLIWGIIMRIGGMIMMFEAWIGFESCVNINTNNVPLYDRQTTGAFLERTAAGIDLARLKTVQSLVSKRSLLYDHIEQQNDQD